MPPGVELPPLANHSVKHRYTRCAAALSGNTSLQIAWFAWRQGIALCTHALTQTCETSLMPLHCQFMWKSLLESIALDAAHMHTSSLQSLAVNTSRAKPRFTAQGRVAEIP